ncbi:pilus assembly FimT family protein [Pseudomonas sp. LRF_L74]|uniref:pilus assembly FimT family protein n=1 Tax=Pseudomonas sp. LRF_L74 TaxID=3369422 RepID=UPI003F627C65
MPRHRSDGFTIIELMIVVALLAIFASIALPAFNSLIENNRVKSAADEFQALLISARSNAVTLRKTIDVTQTDTVWSSGDREMKVPDSVTVEGNEAKITFYPNGTASVSSTSFSSAQNSTSYTISTSLPGLIKKTQD